MPNLNEQDRARQKDFEEWAHDNGFKIRLSEDDGSADTYFHYETEQRWIVWQAARRQHGSAAQAVAWRRTDSGKWSGFTAVREVADQWRADGVPFVSYFAAPPVADAEGVKDERELFEEWARDPVRSEKLPLDRWPTNDGYKDTRTYIAFYGWKSRAALSRRPAAAPQDSQQQDIASCNAPLRGAPADSDLLPLPTPSAYGIKSAQGHDPDDGHKLLIGLSVQPCGSYAKPHEVALFTTDQVRAIEQAAYARAHLSAAGKGKWGTSHAALTGKAEVERAKNQAARALLDNVAGQGSKDSERLEAWLRDAYGRYCDTVPMYGIKAMSFDEYRATAIEKLDAAIDAARAKGEQQ